MTNSSDFSRTPLFAWQELRSRTSPSDLDTVSTASNVQIRAGFVRFSITTTGAPRLMIPIRPSPLWREVAVGTNIQATRSLLMFEGLSHHFLDVSCQHMELESVFSEFSAVLLDRLAEGADAFDAVDRCVDDFRGLFAGDDHGSVSRESAVGLAGELQLLYWMSTHSSDVIRYWFGPQGARHDFQLPQLDIEVKTSTRADAQKIKINGLEQLSPSAENALMLCHIKIEVNPAGGLTIGMLVDSILALSVNRSALFAKLRSVGCLDPYSYEWNEFRFDFINASLYRVGDDFPRLSFELFRDNSPPAGISSVQYSLDLGAATAFCIARSVNLNEIVSVISEHQYL